MVDDRPQFANAKRHPEAAQWVVGDMAQVFAELPIDEQSYVIAATRGHQHDEVVVEQAIRTPARYIGMLGSERKKVLMWQRLEARGGSRARLEQVYAPVGLNIGADTPEEIAVSVVAELVRVRRGAVKQWKTKTMEPTS
jgi:xanthine dehydrogenase accessory factor